MSGETKPFKTVLLVDDDDDVLHLLAWAFVDNGFEVAAVDSGTRAVEMLAIGSFDALVTDLRLPDFSGAEIIRQMRDLGVVIPTVVISGYAGCLEASRLHELGVDGVLPKPFRIPDLLQQVRGITNNSAKSAARPVEVEGGRW